METTTLFPLLFGTGKLRTSIDTLNH